MIKTNGTSKKPAGRNTSPLIFSLGALSLFVFFLAQVLPGILPSPLVSRMNEAAQTMVQAGEAVSKCRLSARVAIDAEVDVNETGFIGLDTSSITTSLGSLQSKRTSTNPNFAALLVYLLHRAGVEEGDCVAVGASGSFPALIVAALSACRALGARPLLICSLGASQWGANHPRFHWLNMWECLKEKGLFSAEPVAWSLGGDRDTGRDMNPEGRARLQTALEELGLKMISEPDLSRNISERMRLLQQEAGGKDIKAFINVGGSWANLGTDESVLKINPGLSMPRDIPIPERRGMIQEMAWRGVPVIHCLFIHGLAREFGLPWDPSPLPDPGEGGVFRIARERHPALTFLILIYILAGVLMTLFRHRARF